MAKEILFQPGRFNPSAIRRLAQPSQGPFSLGTPSGGAWIHLWFGQPFDAHPVSREEERCT
jgi:hypothetical protein